MSDDLFAEDDDANTPLEADEREALIPSYITLRRELNEAEQVNIAGALKNRERNGSISLVVPDANSMGLALRQGEDLAKQSLDAALQALSCGAADALVVLENDLYRHAQADKVDAALAAAKVVIGADA